MKLNRKITVWSTVIIKILCVLMNLYLLCVAKKNIFTVKVVQKQLGEIVQRSCGVFVLADIPNSIGHSPAPIALVVELD